LFAVVLHIVGMYVLTTGLSHSTIALVHGNTQAVVTAELPKNYVPPSLPPDFKPPPVVAVLPDVEITLSVVAPRSPSPAAMTHAPTEIPPTLPVPITSHAVTSDDYPPLSIRLAEQGLVKIKYLVQADGTVGECSVITSSGSSRLDDAACTMVKRRWRFTPATQKGKPVAEYLLAEVSFELVPSFDN
jgi:protein TonB